MVATSGTKNGDTWVLARSLVALIHETDERFPGRDHGSDGSVASTDHSTQNPDSDHEVDDGYVHAVDIDEDLSPALHSLRFLWDTLVDRRDHRVKYLIYEGRIVKSYVDSAGRAAWVAQPYTGLNAHAGHLHVSIWHTDAARNDTGPWWPDDKPPPPIEEDTVVITRKSNVKHAIAIIDGHWYMSEDGGIRSASEVLVDESAWSGITERNKSKIVKV